MVSLPLADLLLTFRRGRGLAPLVWHAALDEIPWALSIEATDIGAMGCWRAAVEERWVVEGTLTGGAADAWVRAGDGFLRNGILGSLTVGYRY